MRGKNAARLAIPPVFGFPPAAQEMAEKLTPALGGAPAGLRLAAGDPEDVGKAAQRLGGAIGISSFRVVDEQNVSLAANLLHAVGETGERDQPRLDGRQIEPERDASGHRAGSVLCVVRAAQTADAGELRHRMRL